jgi:hypothetical protein
MKHLQSFSFFGGVSSLAETTELLLPALPRLSELCLCTRYFQMQIFPAPGARFDRLTRLVLVMGKSLDEEELDSVLRGCNRALLEILVIDAENHSQDKLFTPARVADLLSFNKLKTLALLVDAGESIHNLCYALHNMTVFTERKFLFVVQIFFFFSKTKCLERLSLNLNHWSANSAPFDLPSSLLHLAVEECSPEALTAICFDSLSSLAFVGDVDDTMERAMSQRGKCSTVQFHTGTSSLERAVRVALAVGAASCVIALQNKIKLEESVLSELFERAADGGCLLQLSAQNPGQGVYDIVEYGGKHVSSCFKSLLNSLTDLPVSQEDGDDLELMEKYPVWFLFTKFSKHSKAALLRRLSRHAARKQLERRMRAVVEGALQLALVGLRYRLPKDLRRMLFQIVANQAK